MGEESHEFDEQRAARVDANGVAEFGRESALCSLESFYELEHSAGCV